MESNSRPYQYRYRPYDYRENQIREESRTRQNRKQLRFSQEEYSIIEQKIKDYGVESFSEYLRSCIYDKNINQEQLRNYSNANKTKRKQICFSDEEIEIINRKMNEVNCNNFNQFITIISLV
jgi:hypothetical protein